jgi:hypothetical protein
MAELAGVKIEKLQGGLGRKNPSTDSHVALIIKATGNAALDATISNEGKGLILTSLSQAESLGLTLSASANGASPFYEHISEFFRLAPEGTLYLFNNKTVANLLTFIKENAAIKGFGIVDDFGVATQEATIIEYQTNIINALATENRLIDFGVIGWNNFGFDDAIDLTELDAPQISVLVVGSGTSNFAAVGAFLGMLAVRKVNENAGSVDIQNKPLEKRGTLDYTLTDKNKGLWVNPKLTGGATISSLTKAQLTDLEGKGYIYAASYEGYPGAFFTNSKTCISQASDYCFIENNRVWNKAARTLRIALLPEVKGVVKKNPTTGFIKSTTISRWTGIGNKALEQMVANDEISGFDVYISPQQVVNSTQPVKIKASVVMDGIVHEFEVALGLTNSIN